MTHDAVKLTTYFEERDRSGERFLADALFDVYERHRLRTSVLLRGVLGFGQRHDLHSDRLLSLSESLPAVSVAVDMRERIERVLPDVLKVTNHGMVSLERAQLADAAVPGTPPADDVLKLTIYGGRGVRSGGQAGYVAAVELLRCRGATGASVFLGVDGTLHGVRRRARFFARNADVPLMLTAIGRTDQLTAALPELAGLISEPVVTLERVRVCRLQGTDLADPGVVPGSDPTGLPIWQKVTIQVEEQAKFKGHPVYAELARRLLVAGAAGVTALRGVRGFYGDLEPVADRLLSIRRNVPVHVIAVDAPAEVSRWWPVVDQLTRECGLVSSELVPASHALSTGRPPGLSLAAISERHQAG